MYFTFFALLSNIFNDDFLWSNDWNYSCKLSQCTAVEWKYFIKSFSANKRTIPVFISLSHPGNSWLKMLGYIAVAIALISLRYLLSDDLKGISFKVDRLPFSLTNKMETVKKVAKDEMLLFHSPSYFKQKNQKFLSKFYWNFINSEKGYIFVLQSFSFMTPMKFFKPFRLRCFNLGEVVNL